MFCVKLEDSSSVNGGVSVNSIFPHVFGQERVKQAWAKAIENHRMASTSIFYGEEGLGKTTAALDLAAALTHISPDKVWNENNAPAWLDDENKSLLYMLDAHVFYMKPITDVLQIGQFVELGDYIQHFDDSPHVCIIDEAQTMGAPIANAWLKTLEEPKENLFFILISHNLERMLPTVVSRAELFRFMPLDRDDFQNFVIARRKEFSGLKIPEDIEKAKIPEDIEKAYRLCAGNPGAALNFYGAGGESAYDWAKHFWKIVTFDSMPLTRLAGISPKTNRKELLRNLSWCIAIGRNLMLLNEVADEADMFSLITQEEREIAPSWADGKAQAAVKILEKAEKALRHSISVRDVINMLAVNMVWIRKGVHL